MKQFLTSAVLAVSAIVLNAADYTTNNGQFTVGIDLKGGAVTELKNIKKSPLIRNGSSNYTERLYTVVDGKMVLEKFGNHDFSVASSNYKHRKTADITFTAKGVSSFDWLRISKKYSFDWNKPYFTIKYTLKNFDSKPHRAGVWLQTLLNIDEGATLFQVQNNKVKELTHPGSAKNDEWNMNPGVALYGISGKSSPNGIILSVTPANVFAGTYSWCGSINGRPTNTLEILTREFDLAPGAEASFTVTTYYYNNVRGYIKSMAKKPEFNITGSNSVDLSKLPRNLPLNPTLALPQRYVDVKVNRQYFDSIRAITIPADEKIEQAAAYVVNNKSIDLDRPLASKLITLPDGSRRLLFAVPGIAPKGAMYTKETDGKVYDILSKTSFYLLGKKELSVRIALDAPAAPPVLDADQPELFWNGNFEKPNKSKTFAAGNLYYENTRNRKLVFWEKSGKDGSYGIRIQKEGKVGTAAYSQYFMPEAGRKYTISADLKCENFDKKYIIAYYDCFDANGKAIAKSKNIYYHAKASHNWKRISKSFSVPANTARLRVAYQLAPVSKENIMWIDNVSLTADDFSFKAKPALETAREDAIYSGYTPLALLEKISHEYVTPHEKWFKPAAFELPELLYACAIIKSNEDASRREIVELAQRLDLKYTFIPLLPTIENVGGGGKGIYGVHSITHGKRMTNYTLERFRALKSAPKAAIIQGVDFKLFDAEGTLAAEIAKLQSQGTRIIFLNCEFIPNKLLGKRMNLPKNWLQIPVMQKGSVAKHIRKFAQADQFVLSDANYTVLNDMPSTPKDVVARRSPAYVSRDYPFWEYRYLPLIKAIKDACKVKSPTIAAATFKGNTLELELQSPVTQNAKIAVEFKNTFREVTGKVEQKVQLNGKKQSVAIKLPTLPGGINLAHIKLVDSADKVFDASAIRLDIPVTAKAEIKFANADNAFKFGDKVKFQARVSGTKSGDKLLVTVEDSDFRTVYTAEKPAADTDFTIELKPPYTLLYRVLAKIKRNGQIIGNSMSEFAVTGKQLDHTDLHAGMWGGRLLLSKMLRELGFDLLSCDARRDNIGEGTLRNIVNLNMYPMMLNLGHVGLDRSRGKIYRGDKPSDPVRDPCFSDPAVTAASEREFARLAKQNCFNYYSGMYHMLGDEMFLGSTVCYSEHCLKGFRDYLKKAYQTIDKLNKVWKSNFASFDDVVPVQRNVVENSDNLAPWLDHKMFMVNVWSHNYIGKRAEIIQKSVPGAKVGMSGTQVPGYGYDWAQLMKHLSCTAYYNGVQTTLVNQWQQEGSLSGQWGGGYVSAAYLYDIYQRSYQWSNLIKGANMVWNWHGAAYNGDGSPSENLKSYCEEFNLLKKGIAKLMLTADKNNAQVAVLYSQPSVFTAMAGGLGISEWQNTQTGWEALLLDLKLTAAYITYENLADSKFDLSKFKVIILPLTLALSEAERQNLVKFAENGGTVIADAFPGRYDQHGKRITNTVLDKLFPGNSGKLAPEMQNLKGPILNGRFKVAEPALGTVKVTKCGKGKGVLFNVMLNSYQSLTIGGVGGETASAASGSEAYCIAMRKLVSKIANASGAASHAIVTDKNNRQVSSQSILKKAGENYYFAIVRHSSSMQKGKINNNAPNTPVFNIKLPVAGVIYDVREGKKITKGNSFKIKAAAGYGQLFAILPAEITDVTSTVPTTVKAGSMVNVRCQANGAKSRTVYRLEVINPNGKAAKEYSLNSCFDSPEGKFAFQIPFNAEPGNWQAVITHCASGKKTSKTFKVIK